MGVLRKVASISTLGAVDFQSDLQRAARSARLTKAAVRKQTKAIQQQTQVMQWQQTVAQPPVAPVQPQPQPWNQSAPGDDAMPTGGVLSALGFGGQVSFDGTFVTIT